MRRITLRMWRTWRRNVAKTAARSDTPVGPPSWYRGGTDRYVRYVQAVHDRRQPGRWGRLWTHRRTLSLGWGPKDRRFKSDRPDSEEPARQAGRLLTPGCLRDPDRASWYSRGTKDTWVQPAIE
jgi:hypothetical protein